MCKSEQKWPIFRPESEKVTKSVQKVQFRHFLQELTRIVTFDQNDHFVLLREGSPGLSFLKILPPAGESMVFRGCSSGAKLDS